MAMAKSIAAPSLESRILGTIYGNCIGDAIGLLTEFMVKEEAKKYYENHVKKGGLEYEHKVPDFHRSRWKNGDWTDDSDQMFLIMESLQEKGGIDPVDYGQKLIGWARRGFPELGDFGGMGIGATTHHVLHHDLYKTDPHAAAHDVWEKSGCYVAPNGGVMRTSILGVYEFEDTKKVIDNCIQLCKVTHADPRCQASCIAVGCAISLMLRGEHYSQGKFNIIKLIEECYEQAICVFPKDSKKKYQEQIKELKKCMTVKHLKDLKLSDHGKIGYTYKCLGAGFWALQQNDFRKALTDITMEAGDADTNGAVAGALLGCKLGFENLPETWVTKLYHRQWLDNKIFRFLERFTPEVKPVTLVAYKEISQDAESKPEKANENKDQVTAMQDGKEEALPKDIVAAKIPDTDDIPFADEDDGGMNEEAKEDDEATKTEGHVHKVDENNKVSWDDEGPPELAGVHGSTL